MRTDLELVSVYAICFYICVLSSFSFIFVCVDTKSVYVLS